MALIGRDGAGNAIDDLVDRRPDDQAQTNEMARAYLEETDWYVIRQIETGAPMPMDVAMKRRAARDRVK